MLRYRIQYPSILFYLSIYYLITSGLGVPILVTYKIIFIQMKNLLTLIRVK